MNLKNWEIEAVTGAAITGATVQAYVASDTHPNPGSPVASTSTNLSGMWELTGLADGVTYDIKITSGARVKWYKGGTKHNIGHMYDDTTPDPNRNLLANGGQDSWVERGTGAITLPTADPATPNTADGWTTYMGSGDSGTAQLSTAVVSSNSKGSTAIIYNRSGGQLNHYRDLPDVVWQGLKGLTVAVSAQVDQASISSSLRVFIDDGVGTTVGSSTAVVDGYTTVSASRVINASATRVRVGVQTNRADTGSRTFFIDNIMLDITSVAPVYAPEPTDLVLVPTQARTVIVEAAPSGDNYTLAGAFNALSHRIMSIIGAAGVDWKDAIPRTLTQLVADNAARIADNAARVADIALKVAKAGDVMSGQLNVQRNNSGAATTLYSDSNVQAIASSGVPAFGFQGTSRGLALFMVQASGLLKIVGTTVAEAFIPIADGVTTWTGLIAENSIKLGGALAGNALGNIPINNNVTNVGLVASNSLALGGASAGHAAGNIPINSIGITNIGLVAETAANASALGGVTAANYALLPSTGSYAGDGSSNRTIALGFQPSYVLITSVDADPGAGVTRYIAHLMSTSAGANFQQQYFPATSQVGAAAMGTSKLAATGFVVDNADGNNQSGGVTYTYIAFR